jgi:leucyl aminopeptidase
MNSKVADIANMGERSGGMLVAGLFLREFVGSAPWAHLDIAGPSFNEGPAHGYTPEGGTGVGVRTLLALLEARSR